MIWAMFSDRDKLLLHTLYDRYVLTMSVASIEHGLEKTN
jgi:hypothetical protein